MKSKSIVTDLQACTGQGPDMDFTCPGFHQYPGQLGDSNRRCHHIFNDSESFTADLFRFCYPESTANIFPACCCTEASLLGRIFTAVDYLIGEWQIQLGRKPAGYLQSLVKSSLPDPLGMQGYRH